MDLDKNNELDQANLRVIVACCALAYMTVLGFLPGKLLPAPYLPVIYYIVAFVLVSIGLRQAIARWPGNYPWRRVLGMVHDYTGTCFGLVVGGEAALPIYAVMVWVNLGNGMRFGSRYLAIATVLALAALLVVYQITPYWQANPFMVLMLLTTSTVIPVYAHLLLERTRKASEQAAAANREKSRFLAQASHDLRQPIHSIGLFTACLREAQLGEEERRLVDSIDRSLLNVSQLFRSILDLYTLDNGRVQPRSETFALAGFMAEPGTPEQRGRPLGRGGDTFAALRILDLCRPRHAGYHGAERTVQLLQVCGSPPAAAGGTALRRRPCHRRL